MSLVMCNFCMRQSVFKNLNDGKAQVCVYFGEKADRWGDGTKPS